MCAYKYIDAVKHLIEPKRSLLMHYITYTNEKLLKICKSGELVMLHKNIYVSNF